jgi:hypothetical protein
MEPGFFDGPATRDSVALGSHGIGPDTSGCNTGTASDDWLKPG